MSMTFIHRNTDSDLTGGSVNYSLLKDTATGAEVTVGLGQGASVTYSAFTASGVPGIGGKTGNYTVNLRIISGNVNAYGKVQLHRVNSSGVVQDSSDESGEQKLNSDRSWSYTNLDLGTWTAGDRLRVDFLYRNNAGNKSISFGFGTNTSEDSVVTPFEEPLEDLDVQADLVNTGQAFAANVEEDTVNAQADLVNTGQLLESEAEVLTDVQADLVNTGQVMQGAAGAPTWRAVYSPTGVAKYKDGQTWTRGTIYIFN